MRGTRPWGSSPGVTANYGGLDHEEILWGPALPIGPGGHDAGPTGARLETWLHRWAHRGARDRGRRLWLRRGGDTSPFVSQADGRLDIEVINHGFEDITLHVVWSGQRRRLGRVSGTRTINFTIPWERSLELWIEIDVLAGRACTTRPIWADPGDHLFLEVQQNLRYCGL